ncbi:cysteine desulfurase, mitochondrial-like isoform X2 [Hydractinia symbiolongicarpus]|uniref:cysteine desulfurase, mitochondrial-like isoform X2 n=1 Tax=Hydractinia symbiolongicarpus TaxID=13093 RepID=UPI00254B03A4|nr:cysteine desulfurase, mitochondrial-like isoform X2 [Hydractinia symbiolongicarpus]
MQRSRCLWRLVLKSRQPQRELHVGQKCAAVAVKVNQFEMKPLYLDAQATTPLDPRVLDAMLPYSISQYGNPHSRTHFYGWEAEEAVETAREHVAKLIGADPKEIIFTSGATESNNIAVKGVAKFNRRKKKHIITTQTEHKCVLDSCRYLEGDGFEVTYLPVKSNGVLDLKTFQDAIRPDTSLVSVMTVNNEIGVRQPVEEIGAVCKENKIFFHTDAAQAVGKIPVDVNAMNIDLLSISGHKIYGPKGIGALYVRRRPRVRLEPLMSGGGQERGLRSGTLPAPLIVGFGKACEIALQEMEYDRKHVENLSARLINGIMAKIDHVVRNGDADMTYPGCVNLSFSCIEGESLLMALKDIALSSGSACTSASLEPSYVLRALGADDEMAHSSIRFGIGRFTTQEEVDYTVEKCIHNVNRLREMSPLWEMIQEGIDLKTIEWAQH